MSNLFTCMFIFLIITQNLAQQQECKNVGQYCINHWECCSNSCLNYLYKCVGKNQEQQQLSNRNLISESVNINPSGIPENLKYTSLDILLGNVFSDYKKPTQEKNPNLMTNLRFGEEANVLVAGSVKQIYNSTGENDKDNGNVTKCLEIGEKCIRNEECCSERCHGYLHQCVT